MEFPAGQEPLTIVIGISLTRREAEVSIIDPPGDKGSSSGGRKYTIKDETRFREDVINNQLANMYLFAGATGPAVDLLPQHEKAKYRRQDIRREAPERRRSEELEQNYVGIAQTFRLAGSQNNIQVFQGLNENVYNRLEHHELGPMQNEASRIYEIAKRLSQHEKVDNRERMLFGNDNIFSSTVISEIRGKTLKVDVFGRDGSFLRIEVTE